jgi:formate dehydrogenase gamma subunit
VKGQDFYAAVTAEKQQDAHAAMVENSGSKENKAYFIEVCGSCHQDRLTEFKSSVHGLANNDREIPAVGCVDCHDSHLAPLVTSKESKLYRGSDVKTCGRCHKDSLNSYMETFHGKQFHIGNTLAPTCIYCHRGHELPTDSPASFIHVNNIGGMCAGCHGDAISAGVGADTMLIQNLSQDSTRKVTHFRDPVTAGPFSIASMIDSTYLSMIIGIVGFFTLLSTRDYMRKTQTGVSETSASKDDENKESVKRFSVSWRLQHFFWALSFILLAATGLSLKFPESVLSEAVVWMSGGEELRSVIHRLAAIVFMLLAAIHLLPYLLKLKPPGKIFLSKKDFIDAFLHTSYLFGRADKMPLMYRYTWYQKVEYWATVIGGFIVISTGLVMWNFSPLASQIPVEIVFYAQLIHGWEAILAVLVIFVQHFYHVFLNPDVFPMDKSWLTGKTSYKVMKHDHPLELVEIESKKDKADED